MALRYQKGAINTRAKFKTTISVSGQTNVRKIELQKYTGSSKEELLVAIKDLWGAVNAHKMLPLTYPTGITASRAGRTRVSTVISQVNFLKVKRPAAPVIETADSEEVKAVKLAMIKRCQDQAYDDRHLEQTNRVAAFEMLVGIMEEPAAQDALAKHLNKEKEYYEKVNAAITTPTEFYTAQELEVAVDAVTTKVLKKPAYREQVKYLRRTKKPFDMSIEKFWGKSSSYQR